jgi:hypothetical protein
VTASTGSTAAGRGAGERHHLEQAQDLVLRDGVRDVPVQRRCIPVPSAHAGAGAERLHERVGAGAAPVQLRGEVVPASALGGEEALHLGRVVLRGVGVAHPRAAGHDLDAVPGARAAVEQPGVPAGAQQGDLGAGVGERRA